MSKNNFLHYAFGEFYFTKNNCSTGQKPSGDDHEDVGGGTDEDESPEVSWNRANQSRTSPSESREV